MKNNTRTFISAIITGAAALFISPVFAQTAPVSEAIRPFHIHVEETALTDLHQRIAATRWADKETVADRSQGVQLQQIKELVRYWGTDYNWLKAEAKLNAIPEYVTNIDGIDIQFAWIRSKNPNALPLIVTHGWPGSVFEQIKIIGPLTDPQAYGGRAEDAFDVVIPSMPGYGFSERPKGTGWNPDRIARAWDILMKRLGYKHYVSQGGDWGSIVADAMARQKPAGLLGIHVNMPATVPAEIAKLISSGAPAPKELSDKEKAAYKSISNLYTKGAGYAGIMVTRPQTLGYSLSDSPVGLAAFFLDKFNDWTYSGGNAQKVLTKDELLDDITLYWVTNTGTSGARLYWENNNNNFNAVEQRTAEISIPVAISVFPGEIYQAPRSWAERSYHNLIYFHEVNSGGHFAQWEQPQLFAEELRAAFKSLR
jgi:pimeloyl-ACP methyl ester carboxylesterase